MSALVSIVAAGAAGHWRGVAGGLWLVPLPIVAYLLFRAGGIAVGTAEDLVTLLVMVPLGGPHVVATLRRSLLHGPFWRQQTVLALGAAGVLGGATTIAAASAFTGATLAGLPLQTWLLTFFFFWAGLHVLQQHLVALELTGGPAVGEVPRRWLERSLVLGSLYPVSLFRMSMSSGQATGRAADPEALATRLVNALGGDAAFADDYVFRIGRAVPVLPDLLRTPWPWLFVGVAFAAAFGAHAVAACRRPGGPSRRERLVLAVAATGFVVPLFPSLDVAFQGINAWHCLQYLGLVGVAFPLAPATSWRRGVALTLGLVLAMFVTAWAIESVTAGRFPMFGHDSSPSGEVVGYRPGAVLLAYQLLGFGWLLVHYLVDTVQFVRPSLMPGR